jgi:YVTN family beta-propeller protein
MKNLKSSILSAIAVLSFIITSCHKDKKITPVSVSVTSGLYILNQGLFNDNNSSLSFYNYTSKQVIPDIFSSVNSRGLGDTGNDIEIYGSKMYIVVNVSSTIEVVDTKTSKSIKQIKLFNGSVAREPRDIVFYKNNAYVSSYDGTVAVIDTGALSVSQYIAVGRNPEQLSVANGKLYVANSGGLGYPNYDKTVSVINLSTNTVSKTLTVGINPQNVVADPYGNVYVLSAGDYVNVPSSLAIIDDNADVVKSQTNFDGNSMIIQGDNIYFITSANKVIIYNAKSQTITNSNFITDGTLITAPFALAADGTTGEVFVTDAKDYLSNGTVFAFDKTGKKEYSFTAGINPGKIALFKK